MERPHELNIRQAVTLLLRLSLSILPWLWFSCTFPAPTLFRCILCQLSVIYWACRGGIKRWVVPSCRRTQMNLTRWLWRRNSKQISGCECTFFYGRSPVHAHNRTDVGFHWAHNAAADGLFITCRTVDKRYCVSEIFKAVN